MTDAPESSERDLLEEIKGLASQLMIHSEYRTVSEIAKQEPRDELTDFHIEQTSDRVKRLKYILTLMQFLKVDLR